MITVPTTLVLGAGASIPFGFPSSDNLLHQICDDLRPDMDTDVKKILVKAEFDLDRLHWFRSDLLKSGTNSVDHFLERRKDDFLAEGKAAIACEIIPCEQPKKVIERDIHENNWYQYLWTCMDAEWDQLGGNKLNVLTFNYDRSLEYYLFHAMKAKYGKSDADCRNKLSEIPIVHLHGQLGQLPELSRGGRNFSPLLDPEAIRIAAAGIKIIHEAVENDAEFTMARSLMKSSRAVCFLGFGYHPVNLKRLAIAAIDGPKLFGTKLGLTNVEFQAVLKQIGRNFKLVGDDDMTRFLRESGILISQE